MAIPDTHRTTNRRHSCYWCIKILKWFPVLFIVLIVAWSYYAYVVELSILTIEEIWKTILYIILYHVVLVMFCWSYVQTIFTNIGTVPQKYKLPDNEYDRLKRADTEEAQYEVLSLFAKELEIYNRTIGGCMRYCDKCRHVKPDRAHHCSVCGECVLKMDHHCPWVNNCVNFTNYKFFVLFLAYALIYCVFIASTSAEYFVSFWRGDLHGSGRFHILFLFFVSVMFAISLVSLFAYHCYLVTLNRTTLEAFRAPIFQSGPDKNGFHLGRYNNFREVFGDRPISWFLPISTSVGDGLVYSVRVRTDHADSAQAQTGVCVSHSQGQAHAHTAAYQSMESTRMQPTRLALDMNVYRDVLK